MFFLRKKNLPAGPVEYIIAGLGNPGRKYENTKHNTGFIFMDALAGDLGVRIDKIQFKGLTGQADIDGHRCLLLKPQTFMNNSGESLKAAASFYKVPPEKIIVIFDDISLPVGKIRVRRKGTDGGHNGLKSIIYLLNSDSFPRVKIGIGGKPHPDYDLADWVLSAFSEDEAKLMDEAAKSGVDAVKLIVSGKIDEAMNRFN